MKLIDWAVVAFGVWASLTVIVEIWRWVGVYRIYGGIPISLSRQMITYTAKNRIGRLNLWLALILLSASSLYLARSVILRFPTEPVVDHGFVVALIVLVLSVGMILHLATPPGVLLLGTSHPAVILTNLALRNVCRPYRLVSLLRPGEEVPNRYLARFSSGDLRTANPYEWRMVAHHLMDVVPAIIFDDLNVSPLSTAELDRLRRRGLTYKSVFTRQVVRDMFSTLTPDAPLAEKLSQSQMDLIMMSADRGQKFRRDGRGYGDSVRQHERLAELLMESVRPILRKSFVVARRNTAQPEYSAMIRAMPASHRFGAEPEILVFRYDWALKWHLRQFCEVCKGVPLEETAIRLLEDIPPLVSAEAERQFLRQSTGLDESESIAISFLEMAQEEQYGFAASRRAEGHLLVGQAARYRQDWDISVDHLSRTLEEFSWIKPENVANIHILEKMRLAHFLLGEVHMAKYRALGHALDRANAIDHFLELIKIGNQAGSENQSAEARLKAL